jgi:hypothetical protein
MCETMQSSHRLRPAMTLVRALLAAPTESGDGDVERFCAPLPSSPHFSGACQIRLDEFLFVFSKIRPFLHFWGDPKDEDTRKSRWSRVETSKIIR